MLSRSRLLFLALVGAVVLAGLSISAAQASGVPKVSGLASNGQDWYQSELKIRWNKVTGATYQTRWATSTHGLAKAKIVSSKSTSASSPSLNRCVAEYAEVRAIKGGKVGAWSAARSFKFDNKTPSAPKLSAVGTANGIKFTWPYTPYVARYRIRWSAAPGGKWPTGTQYVGSTSGGWVPQYVRSSTLTFSATPHAGDRMMGVAYANAAYAQIEVNNGCNTKYLHGAYAPYFPAAPDSGTGDSVAFGSWNVELFPKLTDADGPATIDALKSGILDHDLQIVALQEANAQTVTDLLSELGAGWSSAPPVSGSDTQILFRTDSYSLIDSGALTIPKPGGTVPVEWARLHPVAPADVVNSQDLFVASIHPFNYPGTPLEQKQISGENAQIAVDKITALNTGNLPVILAGDVKYLREPFCDDDGSASSCKVEAPPTFVRNGFFDAMAAKTKVGYQYATSDGHDSTGFTPTAPKTTTYGVGVRSDYIMLKGFLGSVRYENVFYPSRQFVPSDHDLIFANLIVPLAP